MRQIVKIVVVIAMVFCTVSAMAKVKNKRDMATINLTKEQFLERVYNFEQSPNELKYIGDKPALIDFYASWCGPCKALAPVLEDLAKEYQGKIYIYKVNTEEQRELSKLFNIRSIPTLLFIPMEGKPSMAQGAMPKAELVRNIDSLLLK